MPKWYAYWLPLFPPIRILPHTHIAQRCLITAISGRMKWLAVAKYIYNFFSVKLADKESCRLTTQTTRMITEYFKVADLPNNCKVNVVSVLDMKLVYMVSVVAVRRLT